MPKRSKSRRKGRSKSRGKGRKSRSKRRNKRQGNQPPVGQLTEGQASDNESTANDEANDSQPIEGQVVDKPPQKKKGAKKRSKSKKGSKGKKGGKSKGRKGKKQKVKVPEAVQDEEEEFIESGEQEDESEEEFHEEESAEESEEGASEAAASSLPTSKGGSEGEGSNESTYSGSGSRSGSSSDPDLSCPSGQFASSSSDSLGDSKSSMTLVVPDSRSNDPCAALEDMDAEMVSKAIVRKCHGIEGDDAEEEAESDAEETSHQKEAPDFNFMTTYEEYLDHYVTSKDLYYFESDDVARTITTLGFRVPELLTREQFAEVMNEIHAKRFLKRKDDVHISYGIPAGEITCPLMVALAEREKQNRTGNMACLVYIRMLNAKKQEVSGWIDFKLRLTKDGTELWTDYFRGKRRLIPRQSDLCYYNWVTFQIRYNSSDNYLVTTDIAEGLQFMNKFDRKLITVNPRVRPGDNTELVKVKSPNYLDAAIYDHFLRVKA